MLVGKKYYTFFDDFFLVKLIINKKQSYFYMIIYDMHYSLPIFCASNVITYTKVN